MKHAAVIGLFALIAALASMSLVWVVKKGQAYRAAHVEAVAAGQDVSPYKLDCEAVGDFTERCSNFEAICYRRDSALSCFRR